MTPRLVIGAVASGSGKTTITAGIVRALVQRGLRVQPFKCGPDYIDPGYHTLAAGRPCRNLDTWLLTGEQVRDLFLRACSGTELAVAEGVMGLFDGTGALDQSGSTFDVARELTAPIVLIVDIKGMGRSAAALVAGFQRFDGDGLIKGVILNRAGSARHAEFCASAISHYTGLPCFGYLERNDDLLFPGRHLGLVTTAEAGPWETQLDRVAEAVAKGCDLDRLLDVAREVPALPPPPPIATTGMSLARRPVIAMAQDAAFSFVYPEMSELLEAYGAAVVPFSPLIDQALPPATAGVILSGGFPELYASQLSRNTGMYAALRTAHRAGLPIYAECGGLMYLTQELQDLDGQAWPMVGVLPGRSVMAKRVTLGYRTVTACHDGPLLLAGMAMRGHEFHYSRWEGHGETIPPAYHVQPNGGKAAYEEGAQLGNLLASYVHLFWIANPLMAQRFVMFCRQAGSNPLAS